MSRMMQTSARFRYKDDIGMVAGPHDVGMFHVKLHGCLSIQGVSDVSALFLLSVSLPM
jgi:hypothetical protein